jgi:hypothetical protein
VNRELRNGSYLIINLIFAGIIVAIITYSAIFSADGHKHPVPSGSDMLNGELTISTGLSRSFSAIVRADFKEAKQYNPFGIRVFSFFASQLILRLAACFAVMHIANRHRQTLIFADIVLSTLLFGILCWPFIALTVKQLV